ncbi:protocatechuate 3,4-dioxygenase [Azoarcus sp. KH32C]|uniref:dioxygenase family protein n=1 Tax=Azoarcus sp. KH32C TaxID=748247 RepID=UPI00023865AD|nr:protocatechuate 3,4-dioxygenase [Azoarcus sp. KH32C]BAL23114.1 hypothetical protein AZKH_0775 [Azoarcus sp. KH32C]
MDQRAQYNYLRRRLARGLVGLPLLPLAGGVATPHPAHAAIRPTPEDDLGPFYPPDWSGDIDGDLTRLASNSNAPAEGKRLRVSGVVRDTGGRPIVGATVEIWQADAHGRYRHPGVDPRSRDPAFQGYGRVLTDAQGRYAFLTILPGNYGTRPPHIHFRVARPGHPEFVTQMYFRGNNREGNGYTPPEREALTIDLVGQEDAGQITLAARFDLTLAGA